MKTLGANWQAASPKVKKKFVFHVEGVLRSLFTDSNDVTIADIKSLPPRPKRNSKQRKRGFALSVRVKRLSLTNTLFVEGERPKCAICCKIISPRCYSP